MTVPLMDAVKRLAQSSDVVPLSSAPAEVEVVLINRDCQVAASPRDSTTETQRWHERASRTVLRAKHQLSNTKRDVHIYEFVWSRMMLNLSHDRSASRNDHQGDTSCP